MEGKDAALINLWTSWCHPCKLEYPFLNQAYEKYGDRVAFIGLSVDPEDTRFDVMEIKKDYKLAYPVGREEKSGLLDYLGGSHGTPTTIIVDRFGNAVYYQVGAFFSYDQIERLMEEFLAEDYTESRPLIRLPLPTATQALPVASSRRVWVEEEDARHVRVTTHYGNAVAFLHTASYEKLMKTCYIECHLTVCQCIVGSIITDSFQIPIVTERTFKNFDKIVLF